MSTLKTIVLAGGCFWCTEAVFKRLAGIVSVISGYVGGHVKNPTYEQVSGGQTGHAEAVKIEYDPTEISLDQLLDVFFTTHDPTTLNRQGNDHGPQYRSAIFYTDNEQRDVSEKYIVQLAQDQVFNSPVVTELQPLQDFYPAEDYHQNFYDNNAQYPYCTAVINPKLSKLRQKFSHLLKD